ncbi:MAG: response regulator [Deltaproteobacteria bacterium]|nr:response regulator [Deltaproteobacteria bacterium]
MENSWQNHEVNILVVDDDEGIVEILDDYLRELGYRVVCAANGVEALERLDEKDFDLLLTDINMPRMNGMELVERIKTREKTPTTIMITAYASIQSAVDALKCGVYDYLTKPFVLDEVKNAVSRALEKHFLQRENVNLKEMMALYRASEVISSHFVFDEVVEVLFDSAAYFTKTDFIALYLDDSGGTEAEADYRLCRRKLFCRLPTADRCLLNFLPKRFPAVVAEKYFLCSSSRIFSKNDAALSGLFKDDSNRFNYESIMTFSLKANNRLTGFLVLVSLSPEIVFTDRLRRLLYMLVSKAAGAIENTRLYDNLQRQYVETVASFALALETKDSYTHGHSQQVACYAALIARKLDFSSEKLAALQQAAILHDIGKIGVSDTILNLSRPLTEVEFQEIREHPRKGRDILAPISSLATVTAVVYHHHEHWNGKGYPAGLSGFDIPLMARIIAVADAFDAMTSQRPYRLPLSLDEALAELRNGAGRQFDPELVAVFLKHKEEIELMLSNRPLSVQPSGGKNYSCPAAPSAQNLSEAISCG